ncbi:olfactory receptor 1030-like [Sturnira hondurensis]|uniref:olfactory receptor 1030-like n=1 Tax=Sturnira hondurensis TaxID=192404 RepID=UPI00187941C0|nr:olfactory receptor 1030-like [Sturnira hondurensis]
MSRRNYTGVTEFILLGLTSCPELQVAFFVLFLVVYVVTVIGNVGVIVLIKTDSRLHTPMYFSLSSLSVLDLCFSTKVTPKMLENFLLEKKTISYAGCLVQCCIVQCCIVIVVLTEHCMLAVMAYDHYMATCHPLLYSSKMSKHVCVCLVIVSYVYSFLSVMETVRTYNLSFCGANEINHFYCADPPLIKMACSDTYSKELSVYIVAGYSNDQSLLIILTSYMMTFVTMLRSRSAEGRKKAFSTCSSHLTVVTIFYGALFYMHLRHPTEESMEQGKMVAVCYTMVIPRVNPMILCLRNKDVKEALRKAIGKQKLEK